MECLNKERTVKIEQIQKVLGALTINTLETYFKSWRFTPYLRRVKNENCRWHYEYLYCNDFFNNLYTYLVMKRKIYEAKNLRDTMSQVGMKLEYLED